MDGLSLTTVQKLIHFEQVKCYVALGTGLAILDEYALAAEDGERMRIDSLDRFFEERSYGIISRRRGYLSPAAKAFKHRISATI